MDDSVVKLEGVVQDLKGHSFYTVKLASDDIVLARVASRAKKLTNRLMPGVRVEVEVSTYDLSKGRIVKLI